MKKLTFIHDMNHIVGGLSRSTDLIEKYITTNQLEKAVEHLQHLKERVVKLKDFSDLVYEQGINED